MLIYILLCESETKGERHYEESTCYVGIDSSSCGMCKYGNAEIYARHGRKFNDETLQNYFNGCSWYIPTIEPENFTEDMLSQVERDNVDLIKKCEEDGVRIMYEDYLELE